MPCVVVESARPCAGRLQGCLSTLDRTWEELVGLSVAAEKHRLVRIVVPRALQAQIEQYRPHDRMYRHVPRLAVLTSPDSDRAGVKINVRPREADLL